MQADPVLLEVVVAFVFKLEHVYVSADNRRIRLDVIVEELIQLQNVRLRRIYEEIVDGEHRLLLVSLFLADVQVIWQLKLLFLLLVEIRLLQRSQFRLIHHVVVVQRVLLFVWLIVEALFHQIDGFGVAVALRPSIDPTPEEIARRRGRLPRKLQECLLLKDVARLFFEVLREIEEHLLVEIENRLLGDSHWLAFQRFLRAIVLLPKLKHDWLTALIL